MRSVMVRNRRVRSSAGHRIFIRIMSIRSGGGTMKIAWLLGDLMGSGVGETEAGSHG